MTVEYDNNMEMIMGKVVSDHPNAPKLRVNFEIDGVKYKAGLWPMTRKDDRLVKDKAGNQLYKGKIEVDDYEPDNRRPAQSAPEPVKDFEDDDIPF